jgi:hypothetical protein
MKKNKMKTYQIGIVLITFINPEQRKNGPLSGCPGTTRANPTKLWIHDVSLGSSVILEIAVRDAIEDLSKPSVCPTNPFIKATSADDK